MAKRRFFSEWDVTYKDSDGSVIFRERIKNTLVNSGERLVLEVFFRNDNEPGAFFVRAGYGEVNEETVLYSIPNEPESSTGYAPIRLERSGIGWPIIELEGGDWKLTSKQLTMTASAGQNIGPINFMYLATTNDNSGTLICTIPLPSEITLHDGQSLDFTISVKAM